MDVGFMIVRTHMGNGGIVMETSKAFLPVINYHCPRYKELPHISLYLEQLIDAAKDATAVVIDEAPTGPMINNYVKLKVLPPAVKKRYSRDHLCYLIIATLLKQVFTLPQIAEFFRIQRETYPLEVAYNFFCGEFENALEEAFSFTGNALPCIESRRTEQTVLVRAVVLASANRIFVEKTYFRK